MEQAFCPGSAFIRTPTLTIKKCPECGAEIEIFSNDSTVDCENCGFTGRECEDEECPALKLARVAYRIAEARLSEKGEYDGTEKGSEADQG